ncbi:MAG: prolipoprotein diacylglyceryl transferase [Oscillospiraceae bacterium]|nr:prolipoprotein diacylglyceryl transferase [Oscillospiraceae bacterium]
MEIPAITFPLLGEGFKLTFLPYFTLFGWRIYWYGVLIALGFLLAVVYCMKRTKDFGITQDDLVDMLICAVPLGVICARLYYVIFYRADDGTNPYFDGSHDLLDIVKVWEGGLAIYGGVIGGILGCALAAKLKKLPFRVLADLGGLGLLIGQAVGRWGNFTNREAHGTETTLPWRMGLVYSFKTFYFHPTFLYESLWNFAGFLILHFWSKKRRRFDGQVILLYIAWYGLGRAMIEGLRTDSLYVGSTNLRVSQLIAILTFLFAAAILMYVRVARHPEPEDLWVNRDRKAEMLAAQAEEQRRKEEEAEEEGTDEELSEAYRILTMKSGYRESAPENVPEGPAVEPVDYRESAEVEQELNRAEAEEAARSAVPPELAEQILGTVEAVIGETGEAAEAAREKPAEAAEAEIEESGSEEVEKRDD